VPVADIEAVRAAEEVGRVPGVVAVAVLGSSARGDYDATSDIDLLALVVDGEAAREVAAWKRGQPRGRRLQLKVMTEPRLTRLLERRSTFAVHVLREAIPVVDPAARFAALRRPHSRDAPVRDNRDDLLIRLEPYEYLDWCQGFYLFCLADLYSIGRAAAFTILGRRSHFEFSGVRALRTLESLMPELAGEAHVVSELRPFFLLAHRDAAGPIPFPYRDCHEQADRARRACFSLVGAIR
jgi:predicted nucleotidyltransferase